MFYFVQDEAVLVVFLPPPLNIFSPFIMADLGGIVEEW